MIVYWGYRPVMKILVVDDDPISRRIVTTGLAKGGFETLEAEGGAEAIQILEGDEPVGALLLDIQMPDMTGLDFLDHLRKNPNLERLPVVICSGMSTREAVLKARELNIVDFLVKPVEASKLRKTMTQLFRDQPRTLASTGDTLHRLDMTLEEYLPLLDDLLPRLDALLAELQGEEEEKADVWEARTMRMTAILGAAQSLGAERVVRTLVAVIKEAEAGSYQGARTMSVELRRELAILRHALERANGADEEEQEKERVEDVDKKTDPDPEAADALAASPSSDPATPS
jgi:CheY-like chemotaxis protein